VRNWVGKNYSPVLIAAGVVLLLALPSVLIRSARPLAAGWDDLAFCLELGSFDGKKRLTLADDGSASLEDEPSSGAEAISGRWKVSEQRGPLPNLIWRPGDLVRANRTSRRGHVHIGCRGCIRRQPATKLVRCSARRFTT
jgi:hypothetical protein